MREDKDSAEIKWRPLSRKSSRLRCFRFLPVTAVWGIEILLGESDVAPAQCLIILKSLNRTT